MLAADVTRAVSLAHAALGSVAERDWQVPAGDLTWTCWETVEHMSDDLFAYTAQLAPSAPPISTHVPFGWQVRRDGGPALTVFVEPADGNAALLQVFEACGAMLAAIVGTVPPDRLSFHNYGASDASGFAAMGVVEVLVHTNDVAAALKFPWSPPDDLCAGALHRLFPDVAVDDPWPTLRWATGRATLPGRPRRRTWTWDGTPRR
ncbi:hypothetical protein [Paractinoplanes durhamensis]|uniref:Mycothiol-dependent maleylpyruvate isomerase metal-binding domain-containing protein n=1 Tax=Paractinoplanes durhamensis TaxID=113563 RepID=A0ABQ3Z553_9ACTN|nr:hypothetical protein [Actinoplanes durhamensis]GIE04942.1 hypothetical protein Adu01nite_62920 [Actinoplanes durhamensis]